MNRSTIAPATRALVYLALVAGCLSLAAGKASGGQMHGPHKGAVATPAETAASRSSAATRQSQDPGTVQNPEAVQAPEAVQDPDRRRSFGARGVLTFLSDDSLKAGLGFSGFSVVPLTTDLELEAEIGYAAMNTVANGLPRGRLSVFPFRATLRVQMWRFGGAKPYLGGGGGVYINRFSIDSSVERELAEVGYAASANVDPAFGLHLAGGVEWQRGRVHFGVDLKYVFAKADVLLNLVDQVTNQVFRETSELDLNGFWIAGGVRFAF